jgi:hypothetical protein
MQRTKEMYCHCYRSHSDSIEESFRTHHYEFSIEMTRKIRFSFFIFSLPARRLLIVLIVLLLTISFGEGVKMKIKSSPTAIAPFSLQHPRRRYLEVMK